MVKQQIRDELIELDNFLSRHLISNLHQFDPSVATGHTGAAIFYSYYYLLTKNKGHKDIATALIEKAVKSISDNEVQDSMCNGIAGVAWSLQHMMRIGVLENNLDFEEYDQYLVNFGERNLRSGYYDYLHGGLGHFLYFLERPNSDEYIIRLWRALEHSALENDNECYWLDTFSTDNNGDRVNLGLAHGMPSVIYILAQLVKRKFLIEKTLPLLKKAVAFQFNSMNMDNNIGSFFPNAISLKERPNESSRLAWCYGDLGVCAALLQAGQALYDNQIIERVHEILISTTLRQSPLDTRVVDGGICHGAAGVAHLYQFFFSKFKNTAFQHSANYWIDFLMNYVKHCGGIVNFSEYHPSTNKHKSSIGLLTGSIGAGLVMISTLDEEISPDWNRFLLLS